MDNPPTRVGSPARKGSRSEPQLIKSARLFPFVSSSTHLHHGHQPSPLPQRHVRQSAGESPRLQTCPPLQEHPLQSWLLEGSHQRLSCREGRHQRKRLVFFLFFFFFFFS